MTNERSRLGEWSQQEAAIALECADLIFTALTRNKKAALIGELNELMVFLDQAKKHAPDVPE